MAKVHFIKQGKGGVGKSLAAAILTQFKLSKERKVIPIDTDPVNATLKGFEAFDTIHFQIVEKGVVQPAKFDQLMELIMKETDADTEIIIDNGASSFLPLTQYIVENDAIEILSEQGHEVYIHNVITGGQAMLDTLQGLDTIANTTADKAKLIVWLNEYWGKIEQDDKTFEQMKVYAKHKNRISGVITIHEQSELFNLDFKHLLTERMTFREASVSDAFTFMSKNRLSKLQKKLFEQLDTVLEKSEVVND
ncbi:conjugal transfer protein TraL [Vibrio parahaemolyticus]|nr:conjugal transfer protein TraL [Vibrio parahaemolyticus]